jgi:hypothetical protein
MNGPKTLAIHQQSLMDDGDAPYHAARWVNTWARLTRLTLIQETKIAQEQKMFTLMQTLSNFYNVSKLLQMV